MLQMLTGDPGGPSGPGKPVSPTGPRSPCVERQRGKMGHHQSHIILLPKPAV